MILCVCPNPAIDKYIEFDNFQIGKVNKVNREIPYPGGKGVHVALGITELGEDAAILAFWGGSSGKWIKEECEAKGIKCYGPEVDALSRTCITLKTKDKFNETEILGAGPFITHSEYATFMDDYVQLLCNSDIVSMSGSWPKSNFDLDYSFFIEKAAQQDVISFVDCSGTSLLKSLEKRPFAVHINHREGFDVYNTNDPIKIAHKVGENCKLAAITDGEKGLYLYDGKEAVHALCKIDNVISAVGSGDSLMAGLIVAKNRKYNLIETAKLAAASGAANCIREDLGMFYKKDVDMLVERCKIKYGKEI